MSLHRASSVAGGALGIAMSSPSGYDDTTYLTQALQQGALEGVPVNLQYGEYALGNIHLPTSDDGNTKTVALIGAAPIEIYGAAGYTSGQHSGTRLRFTKTDGSDFLTAISSNGIIYHPIYRLENLTLLGPDQGLFTTVAGNGLRISGTAVANVFIRNVWVEGFAALGSSGIWLDNCENGHLDNVMCDWNDIGLLLTGFSNANLFTNVNTQLNNSMGMYIHSADSGTFIGGMHQSNLKTGLRITGAVGWTFLNTHFENNNSSGAAGEHALHLLGAAGVSNQHIEFARCRWAGATGHNDINLTGDPTGKNHRIVFNGGYNDNTVNPLITIDANSQYCDVLELADPNASPVQIVNTSTTTRIRYHEIETVGGARLWGGWRPSDQGWRLAVDDPAKYNGTTALTAGQISLTKIPLDVPTIINTVSLLFSVGGATLTAGQCLVALYNSAGTRLWVSSDQSGNWTTSGEKDISTGGVAVSGSFVWLAILGNGTTMPTLIRLAAATTTAMNGGIGATIAASRAAHLTTGGQTSMPASFTPGSGSMTQDAAQFWARLS